jgi:seryl-tRNA synthetase
MTLDILSFIDTKGGNSAEIKESQKKRGLSVELVDEIIQMYADWVKSKLCIVCSSLISELFTTYVLKLIVDYDTNALRKKVNEVQKEISAKKKVSI